MVKFVKLKSMNVLEIVKTNGEMNIVLNTHIFIVITHIHAQVVSELGIVKMSMKKLNA